MEEYDFVGKSVLEDLYRDLLTIIRGVKEKMDEITLEDLLAELDDMNQYPEIFVNVIDYNDLCYY